MPVLQIIFGVLISVVLLSLGIIGIRRHWQGLLEKGTLNDPIKSTLTRKIQFLRLLNSSLMIVLSLMLASALVWLEGPAQHLADLRDAADLAGKKLQYSPEQWNFATRYALYWVSFLSLLLLLVLLGGIDAILSLRNFIKKSPKVNPLKAPAPIPTEPTRFFHRNRFSNDN